MSKSYGKNTKEFYNELSTDCNPEKLLEIARQGIFLYEPLFKYNKIKNHEYVVEISILAGQDFMICNQKQYDKLKEIILMKDSLFKNCIKPPRVNNIEYFYYDNHKYLDMMIESNDDYQKHLIIKYIVYNYATDNKILEYCAGIVKKYNLKYPAIYSKFHLNFPLSTLKKYSKEIFLPNNIYATYPDKRVKDLVNSFFTDREIDNESNISYLNKYRKRYDIENDIDPKLFVFHNSKSHNINLNILKNEKSEFNDNFLKLLINYDKIYNFDDLPKKTHYFKNRLKDPRFIKNLLDDPKYILNLDINDCINYDEKPIFLFCYLISLVHNNIYNSFIIKYLLYCIVSYEDVRFEDNKFYFKYDDDFDFFRDTHKYFCMEYGLYKLLSTTPNETFNNYFDIKEF